MKILWASPNTLLDSANGAAIMVRECLRQLSLRNFEVNILGATIFVSPEGMRGHSQLWPPLSARKGKFVEITVDDLKHRLLVTQRPQRRMMLSFEEQLWFDEYRRLLEENRPDLVLFFDKSLITLLTADEAKRQGIPVGVFLMHGDNRGKHWCRDVNWIFTDTLATSEMYERREGYELQPVGTFVEPSTVLAHTHARKTLLFVNPIPAKGAILVVQTVLALAKQRPDIQVEIVDTRGTWTTILDQVSRAVGKVATPLNNVTVTTNTGDMRSVYSRARVLLVPSLWWESGPRVIVEALLNGVPIIGSDAGGIPEVLGDGGEVIHIPDTYRNAPYTKIFDESFVLDFTKRIIMYWDDEVFYHNASQRAIATHAKIHNLERNGDLLAIRLQNCIRQVNG